MDRDAMNAAVAGRNAGLEAAPRKRVEVERRAAIFAGLTEYGGESDVVCLQFMQGSR